MAASGGELALVAGHAVVLPFVWDEGLGAHGLLTGPAHKTLLVPRRVTVLQLSGTCRRSGEGEGGGVERRGEKWRNKDQVEMGGGVTIGGMKRGGHICMIGVQ